MSAQHGSRTRVPLHWPTVISWMQSSRGSGAWVESDVVKRRFRELLAAKDRSLGANFGVADSLLHFHWQLDEAAANAYSSTTYGASHVASHVEVAAAATTTAAATKAAVFEAAVGGIVGSHASSAAFPASGTTSRTATPPRDSIPGNSNLSARAR